MTTGSSTHPIPPKAPKTVLHPVQKALLQNLKALRVVGEKNHTHLVVAFSGGGDSSALLHALHSLQPYLSIKLTAVYYNHHWRPSPPKELPTLHKITEQLQIPLIWLESDRSLAKTEGAAREDRYRRLTQLAEDIGASAVLTAHHADDQVETILFRIIRGTGLDGLTGIQKKLVLTSEAGAPIPIIRPLLDVPKASLLNYTESTGLSYFTDPGNQNNKHQRNLIRNQVLPQLQAQFPHIKNALYKLGVLAEGDLSLLNKQVDGLWDELYLSDTQGYYLELSSLTQLDTAYQRRLIKRFLETEGYTVTYQTVADVLSFIQGDHRHKTDSALMSLGSGKDNKPYHLALYKDKLRLIDATPKPAVEPKALDVPGRVWQEGLKASLTITPASESSRNRLSRQPLLKANALLDPYIAYADLTWVLPTEEDQVKYYMEEKIEKPPLVFRTRQPGDRFQPLGMAQAMHLKNYLINKGIPRFERDQVPLLAFGNQILWIPGIAISELIKVRQRPTHKLVFEQCETEPEPLSLEPEPAEEELLPEITLPPALVLAGSLPSEEADDDSDDDEGEGELPDASEETSPLHQPDQLSQAESMTTELDSDSDNEYDPI